MDRVQAAGIPRLCGRDRGDPGTDPGDVHTVPRLHGHEVYGVCLIADKRDREEKLWNVTTNG